MDCLFKYIFVLLVQTVNAFTFKSDGVTINYHINFTLQCQTDVHRFKMLYRLPINKCIRECGLRNHCAAVNFWRHNGICELFLSTDVEKLSRKDCIHVLKGDINVEETPCGTCSNGKACDVKTGTCIFKECSNVENPENGTILGNVNKIGAVWRQNCNTGNHLKAGSGTLICDTDGYWNSTQCIRDCVPLSKYTGNLNVTTLGYQCQRWELNFPHPHTYHSSEHFPDGSEQQAENYCRSAGSSYLWCYTTDVFKRWDTCDSPDEIC